MVCSWVIGVSSSTTLHVRWSPDLLGQRGPVVVGHGQVVVLDGVTGSGRGHPEDERPDATSCERFVVPRCMVRAERADTSPILG